LAALAECRSTHPIAQSILAVWDEEIDESVLEDYQEIPGHGVSLLAEGHRVLVGNRRLLEQSGIPVPTVESAGSAVVYVALNGVYQGAILLRDQPKKDAAKAISALKTLGIKKTVMLSGDSVGAVQAVEKELELDESIGQLLPGDKLAQLEKLRYQLSRKGKLLYTGDGINDTPVLAAADIGIAMGGMGADAAIETADVVIMGDEPSKVSAGIRIARRTRRIATENIVCSIALKVLVMILSALGYVELWAAVFADVGVCMLCVLNTLRINMK